MNVLSKASLALAVILFTAAAAPQLQNITGTWKMERSAQHVQLNLQTDRNQNTVQWDENVSIDGPTRPVDFYVRREAGTFHFTGTAGGGSGSGDFTFTPDRAFADGLTSRGLQFDDAAAVMTAASVDLTLAYIDSIHASGYPQLGFNHLVAFRALHVTPSSIADLRSMFGSISAGDVISTTALHGDRAYVDELHSMGVDSVTPQRAVTFKALHITKAYVDELASMGYRGMSPNDIVTFKAMHIDSAYLRHLASHGLKNLTAQQVIELKATGL